LVGRVLAHFKIVEKIGSGGMGDVYRARDTKLNRDVALKVLDPAVAEDPERRMRFQREAQAVAALKHPNIVTIYSVEEADGVVFLTMELLEGDSLAGVIPPDGVTPERFFEVAVPLTDAVASAHKKQITHRDLKPANIMFDAEGHLKVLDFGLAKLLAVEPGAGDETLAMNVGVTQDGRILGTTAYMSPEQAEGKPVDHRSDIFSLGIILYELATGARPFKGETSMAVLSSILKDTPESVTEQKQALPSSLGPIVERCLSKSRDARYQSAVDLGNDLRQLQQAVASGRADIGSRSATPKTRAGATAGPASNLMRYVFPVVALLALGVFFFSKRQGGPTEGSSPGVDRTRLVVLPFENLGNAEHEYFADGITGEITARLARLSGLGVISRTSAVKYKQTEKSLRQIGEELDVDYVLEGTIQYAGVGGATRVRIHPQLIRVDDDTNVWGESFDEVLDDIFSVQSAIALQVAAALDVTLLDQEKRNIEAQPTGNQEAYDAFLRAQELPVISAERSPLRIQLLESAVRLDPNFALAHAALSQAYSLAYHEGERRAANAPRALSAAQKALELEPDLPEANLALGWYHYRVFRDYDRALEYLNLARLQLPNDSRVVHAVGIIKKRQGRFEEAIKSFERGLELSPRSETFVFEIGICNRYLRRYADALRYYGLTLALAPDELAIHDAMFALYLYTLGDVDNARKTLQGHPGPSSDIRHLWYELELSQRNYSAALEHAEASALTIESQVAYIHAALRLGEVKALMQEIEEAQNAYESIRAQLESDVASSPDDYRTHIALAQVYAGLEQTQQALQHASKALELMPISRDALSGSHVLAAVAAIQVRVGEYDAALAVLDQLLTTASALSIEQLRLGPHWDPLRDDPRFEALLNRGHTVF
jgi:TolB-like protein/tRNA A-37 threonylcarbamoyl transferase component Bud32/Flp pilus assembly protein TadD